MHKNSLQLVGLVLAVFGWTTTSHAAIIDQYVSNVLEFSSQLSTTDWSAYQVIGAPDTMAYGHIGTSWAPSQKNPIDPGKLEFIKVKFGTPVYANGATIRETWGNGFVAQIDAVDQNGALHTVWAGTDTSLPGEPVNFLATWPTTNFLTSVLIVQTNIDHNLATYEEIDAIQLHGTAVPVPAAVWLFGTGLLGVLRLAKRRAD